MREEPLTSTSFKSSFWVASAVTLWLEGAGKSDWAWGFLIGSAISLFSLLSLQILIPVLVAHETPRNGSLKIGLALWLKAPIYGGGLYLGTHFAGISPATMAVGIGLVPAVVTFEAVCSLSAKPKRAHEAAHAPISVRAVPVDTIREGV